MAVKTIKTDFLGYVVSDDETKYPDGAVHTDGYYYERVEDIASSLGFTKCEIGSFTPTSYSTNFQITHSLGVIPRMIIIHKETEYTSTDSYSTVNNAVGINTKDTDGVGAYTYSDIYGGANDFHSTNYPTFTNTSVDFRASNSYFYPQKYNYILLA